MALNQKKSTQAAVSSSIGLDLLASEIGFGLFFMMFYGPFWFI